MIREGRSDADRALKARQLIDRLKDVRFDLLEHRDDVLRRLRRRLREEVLDAPSEVLRAVLEVGKDIRRRIDESVRPEPNELKVQKATHEKQVDELVGPEVERLVLESCDVHTIDSRILLIDGRLQRVNQWIRAIEYEQREADERENRERWAIELALSLSKFCTLDELASQGAELTYRSLLSTREWHSRRKEMLVRDAFACRDCGHGYAPSALEVHHEYYTGLPWECPSDALVTLCGPCHRERHGHPCVANLAGREIAFVVGRRQFTVRLVRCTRCGGSGYLHNFRHVEQGVCFLCLGSGFE